MSDQQHATLHRLAGELEQFEWEAEDEHDNSLLFAGNNADGPVLGSIEPDGTVVYYT